VICWNAIPNWFENSSGATPEFNRTTMFRTEANHLYFVGNTGADVLPITAALHNLINKQG
jgi:hypothetical protein